MATTCSVATNASSDLMEQNGQANLHHSTCSRLPVFQRFQLLQRPRPILVQQSRQAAVREHSAAGLAYGTVIGFVGRVANALHLRAATWARLPVLAMHGHLRPEGRNLCGTLSSRPLAQ